MKKGGEGLRGVMYSKEVRKLISKQVSKMISKAHLKGDSLCALSFDSVRVCVRVNMDVCALAASIDQRLVESEWRSCGSRDGAVETESCQTDHWSDE